MKKKLIFISILFFYLIFTLPHIPAVEFNTTVEENKNFIINHLPTSIITLMEYFGRTDISDIFVKYNPNNVPTFNVNNQEQVMGDSGQPLCFPIAGIIFYGLIFIIILWVVFKIVGLIVTVISGIVGAFLSVVLSVLTVVIGLMLKIGRFISRIASLISSVLGLIFSTIIAIVAALLTFIVGVVKSVTKLFGRILGLILDIILLIYEFIFPPIPA